ncbi:MAG: glycosyltransferase [Chthoniobacter sp.]
MNTVALAHHWLVGMRGGERVLEEICALFPEAPIHTLVARADRMSEIIAAHRIVPSLLQVLPGATRHYKKLLPLFGAAITHMQVARGTGFVFSSDASMIKGLGVPPGVPHVCYCHSPPRYLWDLHETYLQGSAGLGPVGRFLFQHTVSSARRFDLAAASRVTHFIANSQFVRERIKRIYGREAVVIFPPVAVEDFSATRPRADFYLLVSELTPYKRVDLAVEAFRQSGRRLVVIGDGPEMAALHRSAPSNVTFLGRQSFDVLKEHLETCRAFIFPGIEDFGIAPCEAQAAGAPVIAFDEGGALETVKEGVTGIFFHEQSAGAMAAAVDRFETLPDFSPGTCRANVEHLRPARFRQALREYLSEEFPDFFADFPWPEESVVAVS